MDCRYRNGSFCKRGQAENHHYPATSNKSFHGWFQDRASDAWLLVTDPRSRGLKIAGAKSCNPNSIICPMEYGDKDLCRIFFYITEGGAKLTYIARIDSLSPRLQRLSEPAVEKVAHGVLLLISSLVSESEDPPDPRTSRCCRGSCTTSLKCAPVLRPVRCWELLEKPRGSRGGEKYLTPRTLRIIKGLAAGRSGNGRISPQGWDERVPDLLKGVEEEANRGQPQPLPARNCWLAGSLCDRMY